MLHSLTLSRCKINNVDIETLGAIPRLRYLVADHTEIKQLGSLVHSLQLEYLWLDSVVGVANSVLELNGSMPLKSLCIRGIDFEPCDIDVLVKRFPDCNVIHD